MNTLRLLVATSLFAASSACTENVSTAESDDAYSAPSKPTYSLKLTGRVYENDYAKVLVTKTGRTVAIWSQQRDKQSPGAYGPTYRYDIVVASVSPAGKIEWTKKLDSGNYDFTAAIDPEGNVYVSKGTGEDLLSLDTRGEVRWQHDEPHGEVSIGGDDRLYVAAGHPGSVAVVAYSLAGEKVWEDAITWGDGAYHSFSWSVGADGVALSDAPHNVIRLLDKNGKTRWSYPATNGRHLGSVLLASDGKVLAQVGKDYASTSFVLLDKSGKLISERPSENWFRDLYDLGSGKFLSLGGGGSALVDKNGSTDLDYFAGASPDSLRTFSANPKVIAKRGGDGNLCIADPKTIPEETCFASGLKETVAVATSDKRVSQLTTKCDAVSYSSCEKKDAILLTHYALR